METLGMRLKTLRESRKLTAKAVKEITNIDDLGRYEKDERKPSIDTLMALANFYDVSIDWLLYGEGNIQRNATTISNFDDDEYETIIVSPEQDELWEHYKRLDKTDQARILGYIKATIDIKEEMDKKRTSKLKKGKKIKSAETDGEEAATKEARIS